MSIFKNYLYNLSYQIVSILVPFVTIPYISHVLGAEAIGINAYTTSIISYFILISSIGITTYGSRSISYVKNNITEYTNVFNEIVLIKFLLGVLSFTCFFIFTQFYEQYRIFLYIQSIHILASIIDISWFFIAFENFKKIAMRNIYVKLISLILVYLLVKEEDDLELYMYIVSISTFLGQASLWTNVNKYVNLSIVDPRNLKKHIYPILILFFPQLISSLFMTLNRVLLANLATLSNVGYFDSADKLVRLLLTVITSISSVIFPRLASKFKVGASDEVNHLLKITFDISSFLSFPITIGIICISKSFSLLFFGSSFVGIDITISLLSIEIIFMGWTSVIGNQFFIAINNTRGLTVSLFIATVTSIFLSLFLIPKFGTVGAVISALFGEFIILLVQLFYAKKLINLVFLFSDVYKFLIASLFMGVICYYIGVFFDNMVMAIFMQITIGILSYLLMVFILKPKLLTNLHIIFK